jgi:chemotaxis protein MotB
MGAPPEEKKQGPPAYMVSFGDMMTLILTFFILLVSMSKEQAPGLVADGVGSFIVQLETHGLNGVLSGAEKNAIFNKVRQRFGLPPRPDGAEAATYDMSSAKELLRTQAAEALRPHGEVAQPNLAIFEPGSAELTYEATRYLDQLASTLRPHEGQLLVLEGHAADSGGMDPAADQALSYKRARAVRKYLLETHQFVDTRVEARAWLTEVSGPEDRSTRAVNGRLVTPFSILD